MPITWRNIDTPNLRDSIALAAQARRGIADGLGGIGDVLQGRISKIKADETEQRENSLARAQNLISSISSTEGAEQALNNDLIGSLGLRDAEAAAARSALDSRLSQLTGREYQAVDRANALSDRQLRLDDRTEDRANMKEDRKLRKADRKRMLEKEASEAALGDALRNAISKRNQNLKGVTDASKITPLSVEIAPFLADAPEGTTAGQIGNLIRNVGAFDDIDGFNRLQSQARQMNAYENAVSNALQGAQIREQLNALPKVPTGEVSGAEILNTVGKENKQPLVTDWGWLWGTQSSGDIAGGLQKAIEEVGDSQAVLEAFRNDPRVLEAVIDEGGLGSLFDTVDFDKLTTRAKGYKAKREGVTQQRQALAAELAKLGVKQPTF